MLSKLMHALQKTNSLFLGVCICSGLQGNIWLPQLLWTPSCSVILKPENNNTKVFFILFLCRCRSRSLFILSFPHFISAGNREVLVQLTSFWKILWRHLDTLNMAGLTEPCTMEQRSGWNSFGSLAFVAKSAMYLKFATSKNGWKLSALLKFLDVHMIFMNTW